MKILCLHGMGTNPPVFEAQTAKVRALLGPTFSFDFIEGEKPCEPAPGIAEVYSGPYIAFYEDPTPEQVAEAHDLVNEVIEEDGPFDGIMGFSQGAALAASLILQRQTDHPTEPAQFRFAIFMCGMLPCSPYAQFNDHLLDGFRRTVTDVPMSAAEEKDRLRLARKAYANDIEWTGAVAGAFHPKCSQATGEEFIAVLESLRSSKNRLTESLPASYHPAWDPIRIEIPTAHIVGAKDPWNPLSLLLKQMCTEEKSKLYDHRGGHEIPRSETVAIAIKDCIIWASDKASFDT